MSDPLTKFIEPNYAEKEGFEPSVPLRVHQLSKLAHSTTLTPLRRATKVLKKQKFFILIENPKMNACPGPLMLLNPPFSICLQHCF
jgi:hypothetical protein